MKIQFTLLLAVASLLFSIQSKACESSLFLQMDKSEWYSIEIDGELYPDFYGSISFEKMPSGKSRVKIYKYLNYKVGYKNEDNLIYKGWIEIPYCQNVYGEFNELDAYIRLKKMEETNKPAPLPDYGTEPIPDDEFQLPGDGPRDVYDDDNYNGNNDFDNDPYSRKNMISKQGFFELRDDVLNTDHDHNKKRIIEYAIDYHLFSSALVRELLHLLDHDHTKVEIAKYAYRSVVDPENYNMIFPEFVHDHSVQQVLDHMRRR